MLKNQVSDPTATTALIIKAPPAWVTHARGVAFGLFLIVFTGLYFYIGTHLIGQTNPNRQKHDQQNNITLAKVAASHMTPEREVGFAGSLWRMFPHHTDGVVNPLWPWVAARFYEPGMSDQEFYVRGKWVNLIITAVFCILLGLIASRYFSLLATCNLILLVGFGAMLPRSPYFQPEPLYYIFFFLSWLCCLALLKKNSIWRYCLLGALAGVAYLAKTSIQPLLIAFVAVSSYRFLFGALPAIIRKDHNRPGSEWCWQTHIIGVFFLVVFFLMTAGPRLSYANERYGSPFHSYPSYWMWLDDFDSSYQFMGDHQDKSSLRRIPSGEVPSAGNYSKKHSGEQAVNRLSEGFWFVSENFVSPKRASEKQPAWRQLLADRGAYLAALLVIIGLFAIWHRFHRPKAELTVQKLQPEWSSAALFIVGTTIFYALSYGWYLPIGKGDRFMLSLFPPLVFSLIWAAEGLENRFRARGGNRIPAIAYRVAHLAV
ncbi:MAG: hypothetical protein ACI9MB_005044, partial [Verrucomicrobiales bacterium]